MGQEDRSLELIDIVIDRGDIANIAIPLHPQPLILDFDNSKKVGMIANFKRVKGKGEIKADLLIDREDLARYARLDFYPIVRARVDEQEGDRITKYTIQEVSISTVRNIDPFILTIQEQLDGVTLYDKIETYLKKEYSEERVGFEKSERVYEYITEEDADEYGGDYEEAYGELATGNAIEHDLFTEMARKIDDIFHLNMFDNQPKEVRDKIAELINDRLEPIFNVRI